jgi:hypothetical protein
MREFNYLSKLAFLGNLNIFNSEKCKQPFIALMQTMLLLKCKHESLGTGKTCLWVSVGPTAEGKGSLHYFYYNIVPGEQLAGLITSDRQLSNAP